MFDKFKLSHERMAELCRQLVDDRKWYKNKTEDSSVNNTQSAFDAIRNACLTINKNNGEIIPKKCTTIYIYPRTKIKGYMVLIASKELEGSRHQIKKDGITYDCYKRKQLYMVIKRFGIEYLIDKHTCYEGTDGKPSVMETTNHVYTRTAAANHALSEEVCDNWHGEWKIYIPKE